jgi:excisionase family DNA binding protein
LVEAISRKFLTVQKAAEELGVSDRHVYNLIQAGHLEAFDISVSGRGVCQSLRISSKSFQAFMDARRVGVGDVD